MAQLGRGRAFHPIVSRGYAGTDTIITSDLPAGTEAANTPDTLATVAPVADSAGASDAAARGVVLARTVSDSAPASDGAARSAQSFTRSATDAAPAVDSAALTHSVLHRAVSDSAGASDVALNISNVTLASDRAGAARVGTGYDQLYQPHGMPPMRPRPQIARHEFKGLPEPGPAPNLVGLVPMPTKQALYLNLNSDTPAAALAGSPQINLQPNAVIQSGPATASVAANPPDTLSIGILVTSDAPAGAEVGKPGREGPATTLADVKNPTVAGRAVDTLDAEQAITSDHPRGVRPYVYTDTVNVGITVNVFDVHRSARAGLAQDQLVVNTLISSDLGGSARVGRAGDSLLNGASGSVVVQTDHPVGVRVAREKKPPVSWLQFIIDVILHDILEVARGCRFDATLEIGVTLSTDRGGAARGCKFDATVVIGTTLTTDKPQGVRGCFFQATQAIGVNLTSDHPQGVRGCFFQATQAIGVNVTSDVKRGSRAGLTPSSLSGDLGFTGQVVVANPNWPLVGVDCDFTATVGPPSLPGVNRVSLQAAYRTLAVRKINIQRGRQYELDQVQAGQCTIEIPDIYENLNPDNPNSPFNQNGNVILPYRPMQVWAMWPNQPGSGNIYAHSVSAAADPSFEVGTGPIDGLITPGSGTTFSTTTAQFFIGTQSLQVTQGGSGLSFGVYAKQFNVTVPEPTYTASAYVMPTGGATVTIRVVDGSGNVWSGETASTQNVWQRIAVVWNAVETLEPIQLYATGPGNPTFYVDAMQLEFGAAATTFTTSGPTFYALFTGYVERFPTHYDFQGYRAIKPMVAVDALALLSRTSINQQYDDTIRTDDPQFVLKFDETSGPPLITGNPPGFASVQAPNGGTVNYSGDTLPDGSPAISLQQQIQQSTPGTISALAGGTFPGATTITTNDSFNALDFIQIESGGDPNNTVDDSDFSEFAIVKKVTGTAAPFTLTISTSEFGIVGLQNDHPTGASVISFANQNTFVSTPHNDSYSVNFGGVGATFEGWFKPTVGDVTFLLAGENLSGSLPTGFTTSNPFDRKDTFIGVQSTVNGLQFRLNDVHNQITPPGATKSEPVNIAAFATMDPNQSAYSKYPDGQWHYFAVRIFANPIEPNAYSWRAYIDDFAIDPQTLIYWYQSDQFTGGQPIIHRVSFNEMMQLVSADTASPQNTLSAAQVAYYPYAIGEDRLLAHYRRGSGNIKEFTGARALRLLNQYWGGSVRVSPGFTAMANDFTYDPTIRSAFQTTGAGQNRTMLDVLQEIQETERGLLYVSRSGKVVFEDRASRYRTQTSRATFGENPSDLSPGQAGYEIPYSDYAVDFDPTYTFSQANLTSPKNQNFLPLQNLTALQKFGQRVVTQQLQAYFDFDVLQAAIFYLTRYAQPRTRLTKMTLKPAANPAIFPTVLPIEISHRYTVTRRSPYSGLAVSNDYYTEQVNTTIDIESGEWSTELQMSPVFVKSAWVLGDSTYGVLGQDTYPIY